ncbi:hypothetical protein HZC07_01955 [Candidatus Micrarchaeota archaeon]|nr:hypothetical protein [Candidatus Micrarchaeota archaeon]
MTGLTRSQKIRMTVTALVQFQNPQLVVTREQLKRARRDNNQPVEEECIGYIAKKGTRNELKHELLLGCPELHQLEAVERYLQLTVRQAANDINIHEPETGERGLARKERLDGLLADTRRILKSGRLIDNAHKKLSRIGTM